MYKKYTACFVLTGFLSLVSTPMMASIDNAAIAKTLNTEQVLAKKILEDVTAEGISPVALAVAKGKYTGPNNEFEVSLLHPDLTVAATSGLGIPNSEINAEFLKDPHGIEIGKIMDNLPVGASTYKIYEGRVGIKIVPVRAIFMRGEDAVVMVKSPTPDIHLLENIGVNAGESVMLLKDSTK